MCMCMCMCACVCVHGACACTPICISPHVHVSCNMSHEESTTYRPSFYLFENGQNITHDTSVASRDVSVKRGLDLLSPFKSALKFFVYDNLISRRVSRCYGDLFSFLPISSRINKSIKRSNSETRWDLGTCTCTTCCVPAPCTIFGV